MVHTPIVRLNFGQDAGDLLVSHQDIVGPLHLRLYALCFNGVGNRQRTDEGEQACYTELNGRIEEDGQVEVDPRGREPRLADTSPTLRLRISIDDGPLASALLEEAQQSRI